MFQQLIKFRNMLYDLISHRRAATLNLIDANASPNHGSSVTGLALSQFFERKYNSITKVIKEFELNGHPKDKAPFVAKKDRTRLFQLESEFVDPGKRNFFLFGLDTTPQQRQHSPKLSDKTIVYSPNQAPGNKPISVGHSYSLLAFLPEKKTAFPWIAPLDFQRVQSNEKGHEVGLEQLFRWIDANSTLPPKSLFVSVGDSSYSSQSCQQRVDARKQGDVIHIARIPSNRNIYRQAGSGRRKYSEQAMKPNTPRSHFECDLSFCLCTKAKDGSQLEIKITGWRDVVRRGTRQYKGFQHPFDLYSYQIIDCQTRKSVYKKPLWLSVFGKKRKEIAAEVIYESFRQRPDLEHFFRFGKQHLKMSAFQTPETEHEENWWQLSLLSYWQLYLARTEIHGTPYDWEKYLPEFKQIQEESSPSRVKRCFDEILLQIGTPAHEVYAIPPGEGRLKGKKQKPRENHDILFKGNQSQSKEPQPVDSTPKTKLSGFEKTDILSKPQSLEQVTEAVQQLVCNAGLEMRDLVDKLSESLVTAT